MKILLVDEWGAYNSVRIANDLSKSKISIDILREFTFEVKLPRNAKLLPPVPLPPGNRVPVIDAAVKESQPDIIMPLDEQTLLEIWEVRPPWLDQVQPRIDLSLLHLYRDKHRMEVFAGSLGLPVPRTLYLEGEEGLTGPGEPASLETAALRSRLETFGVPMVVKGSSGCMGQQVRIVETLQQAEQAVRDLFAATGRLPALQQYIDGPPFQAGGLFDQGRAIRFLAGEKITIQPPRTGPAIALKSVAAPELLEYSATLLTALGFSGIAGVDYVQDRAGQFYFLEVNPRIWGSYGFAGALGIDLFSPWWQQIRGASLVDHTDYPAGRTWAKMPDYVLADPRTRSHLLRRLFRPLALKSLAWTQPSLLLHQMRRIAWALRE